MDRYQKLMIANGLLVTLVSMFAGFMLMFKLLGGFEIWPGNILQFSVYGTTEGWVRAHTGGVTNGMLVVLFALALPKLDFSAGMNRFCAWGLIYVAWTFTLFYWVGNAVGNRALTMGDNPMGEASLLSVIGFLPGLPSVILAPVILYIGARAALRAIQE